MSDDPYPFESDDDVEIRELNIEDVDALADARITVGQLAGESESWRYGHVIVDEAQDLTPMQWRMVMRRVRGKALTIVGDLAQRSASTATRWEDVLPPELANARRQDLTVNYRSPAEVHQLAVAVLADFAPGIAPSRAIRSSGIEPEFCDVAAINASITNIVYHAREQVGGQVAVIAVDVAALDLAAFQDDDLVRLLSPNESKGLEFDAVVLVEPAEVLAQPGGAAQLYIALTRATQRLIVVHQQPLPTVLQGH